MFFSFGRPSHLGSVFGAGRGFFGLACSDFSHQDGDSWFSAAFH